MKDQNKPLTDVTKELYRRIPYDAHENLILPQLVMDELPVDLVAMLLEHFIPEEVIIYLTRDSEGHKLDYRKSELRYNQLVFGLNVAAKVLVGTLQNEELGGSSLDSDKQIGVVKYYILDTQRKIEDILKFKYEVRSKHEVRSK